MKNKGRLKQPKKVNTPKKEAGPSAVGPKKSNSYDIDFENFKKIIQRQQSDTLSAYFNWMNPLKEAAVEPNEETLAFLERQRVIKGKGMVADSARMGVLIWLRVTWLSNLSLNPFLSLQILVREMRGGVHLHLTILRVIWSLKLLMMLLCIRPAPRLLLKCLIMVPNELSHMELQRGWR